MFTLNALFGPLKFGIPPKNHMVIPHIFMEVVLNTNFLNLNISLKSQIMSEISVNATKCFPLGMT